MTSDWCSKKFAWGHQATTEWPYQTELIYHKRVIKITEEANLTQDDIIEDHERYFAQTLARLTSVSSVWSAVSSSDPGFFGR